MKNKPTTYPQLTTGNFKNFFSNLKAVSISLLILIAAESGYSQKTLCDSLHPSPACNLDGPLKACLNGGLLTSTATIAFSPSNPSLFLSLPVNTAIADIFDTTFISYDDSEYIENIILNPGVQAGSINLEMDTYVSYADGCMMHCECSKSITIVNGVSASSSFTPVNCHGDSSVLTITGSGADTITYTILPNGPANKTGVFKLPAATYTIKVEGEFNPTFSCDTTIIVIITQPDFNPVIVNFPAPVSENVCASPAQISTDFQNWLNGFSTNGGTNPTTKNNKNINPPDACTGGFVTVYDSVFSDCELPVGFSSTFTVASVPNTALHCANDTMVAANQAQSAIDGAFQAWLATANASGGCSGTLSTTPATPRSPSACGGATVVTWTYTASSCGHSKTCSATFTVPTAVPLSCSNGGPLTCTLLSANLSANSCTGSGINYAWSGPSGFNSTLQCPVASLKGIYTVTASLSGSGCSNTCSTTLDSNCTNNFAGCTLGFWKNHVSIWSDAGSAIPTCIASAISILGTPYSGNGTTNSSFASAFGVTSAQMSAAGLSPSLTLLKALQLGGGGFSMMARQGVASLLNTCSIKFPYTPAKVLSMMHNAIDSLNSSAGNAFAQANEQQPDNCPPAGKATKRLMNDDILVNENITISVYPNPFSNKTTIEISPDVSYNDATVELYDIRGQKITMIYAGAVVAGQTYTYEINASGLAAGIYIYSFKGGEDAIFGKIILIK